MTPIFTHYCRTKAPRIIVLPTSCRCGGGLAFLVKENGLETMLGCVCHHVVEVSHRASGDPEELVVKVLRIEEQPAPAEASPSELPRNPDGHINNCLLAWSGSETDPTYGPCQMCNGTCPDRALLLGRVCPPVEKTSW